MTNQTTVPRMVRPSRLVMVLVGLLAAIGLATATAPAAWAAGSITVDGSTPGASISTFDGDVLTLAGSGFTNGYYKTAAICNTDDGGNSGTHCDELSGHFLGTSTSFTGVDVDVAEVFENFNFQTGQPTDDPSTFTDCTVDTCELQIVEYQGGSPGPVINQLISIPLDF